jgi:gamma-glutamyltranspeptidase / glutathione hydrolase
MDFNANPHRAHRVPMYGANGAVATSQPLAAQVGLEVLRDGGNAVDAAIAAAATLTVVEPTSNGIGSDAFALIWDGSELHGLNASGGAPGGLSADGMRDAGFGEMPNRGWDAVTVPGCVDAWHMLGERFGRNDFATNLRGAIALADDGFPLSPVVSFFWQKAAEEFGLLAGAQFEGWNETFLSGGRAPAPGQLWKSPGHAKTLATLAERGARDFYEGSVADAILKFSQRSGGHFTSDDLAAHHGEWVAPIGMRYGDADIWEIPPNGAGIAALQALGMLDKMPRADGHLDADGWHRSIEAMKLAYADAREHVADERHAAVPTQGLLSSEYLAERRAMIGDRAGNPLAGKPPSGGTVYLCTADRDGMMVSYIQSNFEGFGSGVVVPGMGISMQNRGLGFSLTPGHLNELAPGKRPYHTIIPGFMTRGGAAVGPFGVMGGFMQPQGHLQVAQGTIDHGLNAQAVLDAPRWRAEGGLEVSVESNAPDALVSALSARGHQILRPEHDIGFGRGQIIWAKPDGVYEAGTESRADGLAAVY